MVCANKVHKKQCDLLLPLASVQLPRLQNHATERHSQKYPSSVQEPFDRVFFCCTWTAVPGAIHGALFVKSSWEQLQNKLERFASIDVDEMPTGSDSFATLVVDGISTDDVQAFLLIFFVREH